MGIGSVSSCKEGKITTKKSVKRGKITKNIFSLVHVCFLLFLVRTSICIYLQNEDILSVIFFFFFSIFFLSGTIGVILKPLALENPCVRNITLKLHFKHKYWKQCDEDAKALL